MDGAGKLTVMSTKYKTTHTLRYRDNTRTNTTTGARYSHGGARHLQRKVVVPANPREIEAWMLLLLSLLRVFVTAAYLKPIIWQDTGQKESIHKQGQDTHTHAQACSQGHHKHNTCAPAVACPVPLCPWGHRTRNDAGPYPPLARETRHFRGHVCNVGAWQCAVRTKAHAGQGIICQPVLGSGEPLRYLGGRLGQAKCDPAFI